ncbi:hypothetical protein PSHT_10791 [Puccinia striiformis]|uniref:Uncharacterized protein n=1 Tax=Puccinia striiformis TaxID=27350 RepID=A0A2S4V7M6_9BASI|nr:hypothetical protein PSHT_10791 [Puccinia striiformis]
MATLPPRLERRRLDGPASEMYSLEEATHIAMEERARSLAVVNDESDEMGSGNERPVHPFSVFGLVNINLPISLEGVELDRENEENPLLFSQAGVLRIRNFRMIRCIYKTTMEAFTLTASTSLLKFKLKAASKSHCYALRLQESTSTINCLQKEVTQLPEAVNLQVICLQKHSQHVQNTLSHRDGENPDKDDNLSAQIKSLVRSYYPLGFLDP